MKLFITGIGTDVGKTVASAIVVEALEADYWKPVQAGDLDYSDTDKVKVEFPIPLQFFIRMPMHYIHLQVLI